MGGWSEWLHASLSGRQPPRDVYGIYQFGVKDGTGGIETVYIGRARCGQTTLYDRIRRHQMSYGSNGIYNLSQDPNTELLVRWQVAGICEDPAKMESDALQKFVREHGRLPRYNKKNETNQKFTDSLMVRLGISAENMELTLLSTMCLLTGVVSSGLTMMFHGAWAQ
jgi:hypothetical protein